MSHDTDHYVYRILWSEEDQEYVGLCTEFPSLSWLAETQDGAWQGIRRLVADCLEDMQTNDETIPVPLTEKRYSGHFQVRIPPEAHRNLTIQATEAGISLNRLVNSKLTQ